MTVGTTGHTARRSLFNDAANGAVATPVSVSVNENNVRNDVPDDEEFDDLMLTMNSEVMSASKQGWPQIAS